MLQQFYSMLFDNGCLVIGNFSDNNPTRDFMELACDWYLHHRSVSKLEQLGLSNGFNSNQVKIEQEAEGVNLFLHIHKLDA
jgi:hypothetical protein